MIKTNSVFRFRHSNADLLMDRRASEAQQLRQAMRLQAKTDWMGRHEKEEVCPNAKKLIMEMKREANGNFNNETVIRITT